MARRGRKRKAGSRHPSGQLVRERAPDDRVRSSRQPHRRGLSEDDRFSEKAESMLGRFNLRHIISDAEHDAGALYAAVVGAYRSVIEAPRATSLRAVVEPERVLDADEPVAGAPTCPAAFAEASERIVKIGGVPVTVRRWPCGGDAQECPCAKKKARYDGAFAAVIGAGQRAAKAVARVAVHGEAIAAEDFVYLTRGLGALARHFGLTGRGGRRDYDNAG